MSFGLGGMPVAHACDNARERSLGRDDDLVGTDVVQPDQRALEPGAYAMDLGLVRQGVRTFVSPGDAVAIAGVVIGSQ
jgi:hypothetical protein